MAQTGYTPILIYSSTTASQVPSAGNLTNSTLGSELAINITDGKLFYKDNSGSVQVIGWKTVPTSAGGTGLTSYTAGDTLYYATGTTLSKLAIGASKTIMTSSGTAPQWSASLDTTQGGTGLTSYAAGDLTYYASGTTLTKLAIGASTTILTSNGTAPQWSAASSVTIGTATNIAGGAAGSLPYQTAASTTSLLAIGSAYQMLGVNAGGTAPSWQPSATSVLTTQGDLLYASAANTLARLGKNTTASRYLSNSGSSNNPAWAQVDLTNGVTGVLPVANGGTNASSASITAFNNITGYTASGATGTTSTNLVFSTSPSITTPTLVGDSTMSTGNLIQGTAGKGINFTANTAAAGMTTQLLSWYEEGTWTPTILFGGNNTGMTYGLQLGRYTRIGRLVYINCYVYPSNKGSSTGAVTISGLPFTSSSTAGNAHALSVFLQTFTFGTSTNPTARIVTSSTSIQMYFMNAGTQATMQDTAVNVNSEFTITGFYQI